jgi:UDP-3-O-[3-hydroxymyristoyl] N-acetylglucosamine deacetylase
MSIVVEGRGLHGGELARVTLAARDGAILLRVNDTSGELARWRAVDAERSTAIALEGTTLRTVEHLFSALAGLGVRGGLAIAIEGTELPILDGAAAAWLDALAPLVGAGGAPAPHVSAPLRVVREGTVRVGLCEYAFAPGDGTRVAVRVDFGDARLTPEATWDGASDDYRARIAPARTFCLESEIADLARRGLAAHVPAESVVVIGDEIFTAGSPFSASEPARHKLLDLIGDLFLYGGPPRGRVDAFRPGHRATHTAMRIALDRALLAVD